MQSERSEQPAAPEITAVPELTVGTRLRLDLWDRQVQSFVPTELQGRLLYEIRRGRPIHLDTEAADINTSEIRTITQVAEGYEVQTRTGSRYRITRLPDTSQTPPVNALLAWVPSSVRRLFSGLYSGHDADRR